MLEDTLPPESQNQPQQEQPPQTSGSFGGSIDLATREQYQIKQQQNWTQSFNHLIKQRASFWPDQFWQQYPQLATNLLMSPLPEHTLRQVTNHYSQLAAWVDTQTSFAGVQGGLTRFYLKALSNPDPVTRTQQLETADALKQLPESEQNALIAWLKNPSLPGYEGRGYSVPVSGAAPAGFAQVLGVSPGNVQLKAGEVQISGDEGTSFNTEFTTNVIAQLETMFPNLKGKINFVGGLTLNDVKDSFDMAMTEYRMMYGFNPYETAGHFYQRRGPLGTLGAFTKGTVVNPASPIWAVAGAGFGEAANIARASSVAASALGLQIAPLASGELSNLSKNIPVLSTGTHLLDTSVRTGLSLLSEGANHLGTLGINAWNLGTGHAVQALGISSYGNNVLRVKDSTENRGLVGGLMLMGLLHLGTDTLGDIALRTKMSESQALAMRGLIQTATDAEGKIVPVLDESGNPIPLDPSAAVHESIQNALETARGHLETAQNLVTSGNVKGIIKSPIELTKALTTVTHLQRILVDPAWHSFLIQHIGKSPEEFAFSSFLQNGPLKAIQAIQDDSGIIDKRGAVYDLGAGSTMSQSLISDLLKSPDIADKSAVVLQHLRGSTSEELAAAAEAVDQAEQALADAQTQHELGQGASQIRIAQENLASAQARLAELHTADPEQIFYPGSDWRKLPSFLHRSLESGHPMGPLEKTVSALFGHGVIGKVVRSTVDKLESHPFLYNPSDPGFDSLKADANATVIRRYGQRLGMSTPDIETVVQDFTTPTDNPQTVFDALKKFANLRGKYIPSDTPTEIQNRMTRSHENMFNEGYNTLTTTLPDGTTRTEPVNPGDIVNGVMQSRPFLDTEFQGGEKLYLPSQEILDQVTKTLRRWESSTSKWKRYTAEAAGWMQTVLNLTGRTTMMPLWAMFRQTGLLFKHAIDPVAGKLAIPGSYTSVTPETNLLLDAFNAQPTPDMVGSVNEELMGNLRDYNVRIPSANFIQRGTLTTEAAQSLLDKINYYRRGFLAQRILQSGLDAETVAQGMEGTDLNLAHFYQNQIVRANPDLADPTALRAMLERQITAITQASLGNPTLLDYMRTGRFRALADAPQYVTEISDIHSNLSSLNPLRDQETIATLQRELLMKQREAWLDPGTTFTYWTPEDGKQLVSEIQDMFKNNELKLPRDIPVTRYGRSPLIDANGEPLGQQTKLDLARELNQKISAITYKVFRPVGAADMAGRKDFFKQRWQEYYDTYLSKGMTADKAASEATMITANQVRNMSYDLIARSNAERSLKSLFWFAPAQGELMFRWFYAIPAEQGNALIGNAMNFAKLANYVNLFKAAGIVKTDPTTGQASVGVGGVAKFLNVISGGYWKFPDGYTYDLPLSSLEPLLNPQGALPSVAPIPAKILASFAKHVPALKGLAHAIAPYGTSSTFLPYDTLNVLGAFGVHTGDLMSNDALQQQYNLRFIQGFQFALADAQKNYPKPTAAQFNLDPHEPGYIDIGQPGRATAEAAYEKAVNNWTDRLFTEANHIAAGMFAMSALLPGHMVLSTPEKVNWEKFVQKNTGLTASQWTYAKDKWLAGNPTSLPFSISGGIYTGKRVPPGEDPLKLYADGLKRYMTADEYSQFAAAMISKFYYDQRSWQETRGSGQTAVDVLHNWAQHTTSLLQRDQAWQQYLDMSKYFPGANGVTAASIIDKHDTGIQQAYGTTQQSIEAQYIKTTLMGLQSLSSYFTGEGGLTSAEYNSVLSTLKGIRAKLFQEYASSSQAPDQVSKDLNWYFDSVISPYMNASNPIWQQIYQNKRSNADNSQLYIQLQQLNQQYTGSTLIHNGVSYPSPEEFFFDAKSPVDQQITLIHWATEPAGFLTDFSRAKVGYTDFPGQDQMWLAIANSDAQIKQQLSGLSSSSTAYQNIKKFGQAEDYAIAEKYGTAGVQAYQLSTYTPAQRLETLGTFKNDPVMQKAIQFAAGLNAKIQADQAAGTTTTGEVTALKNFFYTWIEQQKDPQFLSDMDKLSLGMTTGPGGTHPLGEYLYAPLFFGEFPFLVP